MGVACRKADWDNKASELEFRRKQTELAREYAPNLVIDYATVPEIIN